MDRAGASYYHRGGDTALCGLTIGEYFNRVCQRFPQREAVVSMHQNRRLTYQQLQHEVIRLAHGLRRLGFARGDRIGIWSSNNVEWILLQLASARIGVILVNINPAYRGKELQFALQHSEVQGLFTIPEFRSSDYCAMLMELIPQLKDDNPELDCASLPFLRRVVLYDPDNAVTSTVPAPGFTSWQDVFSDDTEENYDDSGSGQLDRDDVINIQYTSGTTGFPKAVMLSHHNILNNALFAAKALHIDQHDRLCVPLPFYHCFGMVLSNLLCFSSGACVVISGESFDPGQVLQAIDQERCTAIHGVPTMFIAELEHEDFTRHDLSSLRTGIMAGAPCPAELMKRVIDDMHCRDILIGYGQTEASPLTHLTTSDDSIERRVHSVGRNLPHQEVKIIDRESGQTVAIGDTGEICFRGYHVMRGYYGEKDKTDQAVDAAGWLHSGDLGAMDAEGYVQITGRSKDMIIRGGENIYPREIEELLFTHPDIADAAVFGIPDDYYGEQVVAWIQPHRTSRLDEDQVRDFCREHMAHFKTPRYVRFVEDFPMTVTGKLQKFRMREMMIEILKGASKN